MKKSTFLKSILFVFVFLQSLYSVAQVQRAFSTRFDTRIKGDMLLIGNNILSRETTTRTPNDDYNGNGFNSNFTMKYIDIDNDPLTFSSSSAKLTIPNPACYKIKYAALYWGAILQTGSRTNINRVKLKLPGATTYTPINGTIIYDANATPIGTDNNKAYACFADVTNLLTPLADAQGTYTIADVLSSEGSNGGTGLSAGWSLYVVYEDPTLPAKYITTFDGFASIGGPTILDIPVSGFTTIPTGPVRVKFAFAALEGDNPISGDYLQINGSTVSAVNAANQTIRSATNFFNSSVTYIDPVTGRTENFLDRTPKSTNTLGYDAGILNISNANNSVIANGATSATIRLGSTQDVYFYYFNAFAVDIIEPKIVLTKIVEDASGNNISNQNVTLGQRLNYIVGVQNTGNDDARGLTIRDVLPINTIFNVADLDLPAGVTLASYDAGTRSVVFNVNNNLVRASSPIVTQIKIPVQVVPDCRSLSEACSNSINNFAYATYRGSLNPDFRISDDPSVNTNTGCLLTPQATNFLVGIDGCKFTENIILCRDNVNLVAAGGYSTYKWSTDEAGNNVIGTNQTQNVTQPGTYYVYNYAIAPCRSIKQEFTVSRFGGSIVNPVIPFANQVVTCPNNNKLLPNIFLCGANDRREIKTGINDGSVLTWEKSNCPLLPGTLCADETDTCTWSQVGTGENFTPTSGGQYRLTLNYDGGCFNRFFFNVYQNNLAPTETHTDIFCASNGNITIGNVPSGYEYSLTENGGYQSSNSFTITTAGIYTVYIRQVGVLSNPCVFKVENIRISNRQLTVGTTITKPLCKGDKGTVQIAANGVRGQYSFSILQGATVVNSVGPISTTDYTFPNLSAGNYTINVTTTDGCSFSGPITIDEPTQLKATAAITKSLTCTDGEITVTPSGGTAPYNYSVNGAAFVTDPVIPVTSPGGNFSIQVVDANNCSITLPTLTLNPIPKPVYTVTKTDVKCYNDKGAIQFNVSNANGYTLAYSIDNGTTFSNNPIFSNLSSGTYQAVLRYSITETNGTVTSCLDPAQTIIISTPAAALSASGGVSALAGCTLSNQGGTIRFTNVSGGTPGYTYSFDGGSTYQVASSKDVLPGTYTLVVKDSQGCTFTIPYPVILDPIPTAPTISVSTANFNCDGTGTSTVTVTNSGSANYQYEYLIDGVKNTNTADPKVFLNVPSGPHTISVNYILTSASTFSNLLEENFGIGPNTTTPGIASAYCYHNLDVVPSTCPNKALTLEDNQYVVTRGIVPNNAAWFAFRDHTSAATTPNPNGRFLAINIGGAAGANGILYSQIINDVIPNQPVIVEAYLANLFRANFVGGADPSFSFELVDLAGNVIAQQPPIPPNPNPTGVPPIPPILRSNKWELRTVSLNPGNNTSLRFNVRSGSVVYSGNDAAIDDIKVYQLPATCITKKDFPIDVPSDKKFTAAVTGHTNLSCFNANDGTITIAAQNFNTTYGFDYSLDNGATWVNTKTSPVTVSSLSAQTYAIKVRYDNTAGTCSFDFSQPITAPTAVTVTASVTTQPTCTTGATITAVAAGGTAGYFYELRRTDNTVVVAFKNSGVFTNVATGTYIVVARDANQCLSQASAPITVTAPIAPVATLSSTSDLCYDTVNRATLVVSVTGGSGTLSYSLDGASGQSSNTFTNVNPGTHTIVVTDSNNCTATISNIVIAPELVATPTVSKTLDCTTTNPNATIDVAITGGTVAFTYTVKKDAGAYGSAINVTGNAFSYSANSSGLYTFLITDATGCTVTTMATINAISNPTVTATPTQITCFGLSNGSVLLSGAGGAGGYTYSFNGSAFTTTATYSGLSAGIAYPYQVKDSKECVASGTITLTQPTQLVVAATSTPFSCSATNAKQTATVTITVPTTGTAPYTYSFDNGTSFVAGNTSNYTDNGSDQVINYQVRDAKGCTASGSLTLKALNPPTDLTFSNAAVTCTATSTTVTATATVASGSLVTPLTYEITAPTAFAASNTTGVFAGLTPNTYSFKVTDANGCYYIESYTVAAVTPIVVVGNKVSDVLCNGGTTGAINFTVSGNATIGNYTYSISPNTGTATKTGNTVSLTGLAAGAYTINVTDTATGCTATAAITIAQPTALGLTAVATNVNCNNFNAQITATATGGTANYTYAAVKTTATAPTTFGANPVVVNTNSGTDLVWDVYAKDANGCTTVTTVTIVLDPTPTVTALVNNQCTATGNNFTIQATAASGVAPYTYSIDGTNFKSGNTFNVAPGTYTVTIKDNNGCTSTATPLIVYPTLTSAATTKQLDCSTSPDAVITVTIGGGKANYTYTVQKGTAAATAPSAPITGPTFTYTVTAANADAYTFVITDANACTTTVTATVNPITNPIASATPTQVSCFGGADGAVQLIASGGSGTGYTYSQDGITYGSVSLFTGLTAGGYTFYVKDSKGCVGTIAVTITQPTQLVVAATATPFSCSATNAKQTATVTITVPTTGTAPYSYSFNNGGTFVTGNTSTYTDNGSDQVINYQVRDAKGCIASGSLTLNALNPPTDLTFSNAAITCTATSTTVTATATVASGSLVTPLTYEITAPTASAASNTTGVFTGLTPNTYSFKVTDANGCYYIESYTVAPVTNITVVGTKLADVKCNGDSTGSARFTVGNFASTSSYSYTVNGVATATGQTATSFTLTNLAAGSYAVIVTDDVTGCTATATVTIVQPTNALSASITSNVNANCNVATATVTVGASGGTPAYRYSFVTSATIAGTYSNSNVASLNPTTSTQWYAHIIDANGCTFILPITIATDPLPTVAASAVNQCLGLGTYTITATNTTTPAAGIVTPITYSINNGTYQNGNTFTVTAAGDYVIRMKDGNGCIAISNTVTVNPIITLSAKLDKNITCFLPAAAQITLTAAGGNGTYTYTATPNTGTFAGNVFTTSTPDSYTFSVTDTSGNSCSAATTVAIVITAPVNPVITGLTQTQTIKCNGDATGAFSVAINATQGQAPFRYSINGGTSYQNSNIFTGLTAGTYTVTLQDAKGCTTTDTITIGQPDPIVFTRTITPITCNVSNGQSLGSITINSVTGGTPNYIYHVTGVNGYDKKFANQTGTTAVFDVVDFGFYQIIITDANGCTAFENQILIASPPDDLDISVVPVGATCAGLGSAEVAIGTSTAGSITGAGPFHFAVFSPGLTYTGPTSPPWYDEDSPGSKKTTIPNLLPGVTYTFIVHDAGTGCYYFETADVAIPTNSTVTVNPLTPNNITCKGAADGNVTFIMNQFYGADTPVTYQIYNSQPVTPIGSPVAAIIPASGSLVITNFGMLPFGNYFVLVTEDAAANNAGCSVASAPFDITESAIALTLTASAIEKSNCNDLGVISAEAKDGTAPYTYQVVASGDPIVATDWVSTAIFERAGSVAGIDYIVYAKDAYGCIVNVPVTVYADEAPTITVPAPICYDGTEFTISITGTVDPAVGGATYSVNGSAFQTSADFTFNAAGTYNLVIKDGNGCTAAVDYIVYPQLDLKAAITKELDCTGSPDARITLTTTGGNPLPSPSNTYTVAINGAAAVTATSPFTATAAGEYVFTVTDANNTTACTATTTITVEAIPTPTITPAVTAVSCNGVSDGTITVTVTGGVGPYTYTINSSPANTTGDASGAYTGLAAGSYVVTVTDAKSCTYLSSSIDVVEPTALDASAAVTTSLSCGTANATQAAVVTVTVTAGTGTAPYEYSFDGGANYSSQNTFTTFTAGPVNAIVKDANGCTFNVPTATVAALDPPVITGISGTPIYCAPATSTTSTVTVTTSNGIGALSYAILEPASATTNTSGATSGVFDSLAAGTYLFQVTDANGCTAQQYYTVGDVVNITVTGQTVIDVNCKGDSTGAVEFTVDNFVSTYSYTINGVSLMTGQSAGVISLTGLAAGPQQIVVTDETSLCTATFTVTVTEPAIALSAVATLDKNANCNTGAQVSVVASNGTAGYTYAFALASAGLPAAGDYTASNTAILDPALGINWIAYAKDANGCIAQDGITLLIDPLPTITSLPSVCFQGTPITITINGAGVGPLLYSIGNGYQSSADFVLNAAGTYQLYVQDANGCVVQESYTLLPQLLLDATLTQDLTCEVDASITLTASQGSAPYTLYEVTTDGTTFTAITAPVSPFIATVDGTYQFRVTDTQGCQALSQAVIVTAKTSPTFSTTKSDVTCIGGNDGVITVTAANGIAPYSYAINGGTPQSSNVFPNLIAGTYTIEVKDAKGCFPATQDVIIAEPTAIAATIAVTTTLSCGAANATQAAVVTVTVTTGTGTAPYQYSFDGGANYQDDNTFTTSTAGTVTAYVRDANGCIIAAPVSVDVDALDPPVITGISGTDIWCNPVANQTSTVTVTTSNGIGTLSFAILEPASATTNTSGATSGIFDSLAAGTYLFQVTDANGCTAQQYYTVDDVVNITVTGQVIKDVACIGDANGEIEFKAANYSGTYTALLTTGSGTLTQSGDTVTVTGLIAGTYTLRVTDNTTNCFAEATVIVNEPTILTLTEVLNVNATCTTDARVTVAAAGGTPPYLYAFVPSSATPVSTDYTDATTADLDKTITNWDVYVKDNNNCVTILSVVIATDPLPAGITISGLSQCPSATNDYTFTVNVASGVGPYQYSIGAGFQTSPTFTVVNTGTYNVTVKDANECEVTVPALVSILAPLDLSAVVTTLPTCTVNDGVVDAAVTGGSGSGNYRFQIDSGVIQTADSYSFTGLAPGPHTVFVRDVVTGCTDEITVNLEAATIVTGLSLATTPVSCFGGNNGTITATIATPAAGINDNPVYTYALSGTTLGGAAVTVGASPINVFDNLQAGRYTVTVRSGRGCPATATIDVIEPAIITVPAPVVTQFACTVGTNASNYASITVSNVTGGSGTYVIYEFIKGSTVVQRGPDTVYIESDYTGGSYTVNVYDDNNCVGSTTTLISIAAYTALDDITVNVDRAITCDNLEDITATAVDAVGNPIAGIQYTLVDDLGTISVTNSNGVFTNLNIGNYIITALNTATSCSIKTVHYVNDPDTFILQAVKTADVICFGSNEGAATITLIDTQTPSKAGSFTYTVSGPTPSSGTSAVAGPLNLTGLTAGEYTVTARLVNTPFCTVSTIFSINQPAEALAIAETHTAITCIAGNNDGSISVTATGGWPGEYQYEVIKDGALFSAYSDKTEYTDLVAGSYTINVKDSEGCPASVIVDLVVPTPISLTVTPATQLLLCLGDENGTVEATMVSGGQGSNYTYTLNYLSLNPVVSSGPQQSPIFANLGAGSYSITVTDGYNCSTESATVVINEPTEVNAALVLSRTATCLSSAQVTLSASGGTAPYSYSVDNVTYIPFTSGNTMTFDVAPGTYNYYVKDFNNCVAFQSNDIKVEAVPTLVVTLDVTNAKVNCFNDNNGVIVAKATGGLGNYIYTLYNGSGVAITPAPVQSTPGRFDGLVAGFYQVRVQSGSDCSVSSSIEEVKQPAAPITFTPTITNVSCFGGRNGKVEIVATGGTGAIIYSISPNSNQFFDTGVFDNLSAGAYQIVIQDEAGCFIPYEVTIVEPPILYGTLVPNSILPEICDGDMDGAFTIEILGGTAPYKVSLDNRSGTYTQGAIGQTEFDFTNLSGGTHTVFFIDAAGCNSELDVVMPDAVIINPVATVNYDCVNNAQSNTVTVTYDSSNDATDLDFDLDGLGNYQASNIFIDVTPGPHFINVRHTNGCEKATLPFIIDQVDPLTLVIADGDLNQIKATGSGGAGQYEYSFDGEAFTTNDTYAFYKSGIYTVIVRDKNGCTATVSREFTYIDICIPNYFTPNDDGVLDTWAPGCTNNYPNLTFAIFDRYGREIARLRLGDKWDGKYKGAELPSGDYWYVLKLNNNKDDREFVGHFTLYR